jgi:hypothetical protein
MSEQRSRPPNIASTILWCLRRPGHERQLTDCLGELARVDRGIARGLTAALLTAAASYAGSRRADALRESIPEELTCSYEDPTGGVVVRPRAWWRDEERRGGRLDWVLYPPGQPPCDRDFQLVVEVKIAAELRPEQLADYHEDLAKCGGGRRGLLVLGRTVPQAGLLDDTYEFWLGAVTWEQVLPLLREVRPDDPDLRAQWNPLLDILETRDDLGTEPARWETLTTPESRSIIKRVVEEIRPQVENHARTALRRRPTARAAASGELLEIKAKLTKGRVSVDFFIPSDARDPAMQVLLHGTDIGVAMETRVYPIAPRGVLAGSRKRAFERSVGRLTATKVEPPFSHSGTAVTRDQTLPRHGEVRETIAGALAAEFGHVVSSGVLDEDIAVARSG